MKSYSMKRPGRAHKVPPRIERSRAIDADVRTLRHLSAVIEQSRVANFGVIDLDGAIAADLMAKFRIEPRED